MGGGGGTRGSQIMPSLPRGEKYDRFFKKKKNEMKK